MNKISNKTVREFIDRFEGEFGVYLQPHREAEEKKGKKPPQYTSNFTVFEGEGKKYSDWDLDCHLKSDLEMISSVLEQMDNFMKTFGKFCYVRDFVSCSDKHKKAYQHISHTPYIQFMAFMPEEKSAPFFDIHIFLPDADRELILKHYQNNCESLEIGFIEWSIFTYWRKLRNGVKDDYLMKRYILPSFSPGEQRLIEEDPVGRFLAYFSSGHDECKNIVEYLSG